MLIPAVFVLFLLFSFTVVFFFSRSNETQLAVKRRLATLEEGQKFKPSESTILKQERLSPTDSVHNMLARFPWTFELLDLVKQAGLDWWVSSILFYSLLLAFVGFVIGYLRFSNFFFVLLTSAVTGALPIAYLVFMRYRKLQKCDDQLPQAVELMARALRAGHALNSAIEMVSHDVPDPLGTEFRMVYEEQALGLPLRDALMNLLTRIPRDEMRFLTTALLLQKETGGNLVQILDTTADVMKQRKRVRGQIRVHTAQARASAWVVSGMPFIMFILMSLLRPGYETEMLDSPVGFKVFIGGCIMWAFGILAVKKIATIKV
jgi:tight adherence protein B